MKKIIWIAILILAGNSLNAQIDSIYKAYQRDFDAYKKSVVRDFNVYKAKEDSAFQQFLEKRWKDFDVFLSKQPARPKPHQQPVINEQKDTVSRQIEYKVSLRQDIMEKKEKLYAELEDVEHVKVESKSFTHTFNYFGIQREVVYPADKLPQIDFLDKKSIDKFTQDLAVNDTIWKYNLYLFTKTKEAYKLNDWGFYLLLKNAAESIFSGKNEQTLFIWYGLLKSGYEVKIGYDHQQIYLMLPSYYELFNRFYLVENGERYYVFGSEDKKLEQLRTFEGDLFKKGRNFSFELSNLPLFTNGKSEARKISYNNQEITFEFNTGLIDFFNTYPNCALDVYFKTPITFQSIASLNKLMIPLLEGKKDRDKVNILLNFIHKSIAYKTDNEQFGKERCFFADESLYYPYADCEDRSVILAKLIKHYTGLKSVGLSFPKHIALAVHFPTEEPGVYVLFEGKKYLVCDPTYINSISGTLPPDLNDMELEIINF